MYGRYTLAPAGSAAITAPPATGQTASEVAQAWASVEHTTSVAVLDEFIRQYGHMPIYGGLARARREELARVVLMYNGNAFRAGDRIRLSTRAGTFKPTDTGHPIEIDAGPGQLGIVLGKSEEKGHRDVLTILWEAQSWVENGTGKRVELQQFRAVCHADYLSLF